MSKPYVSPFARPANPEPKPAKPIKSLEAPKGNPKPDDRPKPPGVKAIRYNLTVRLSPDERDALESIGRAEGRPNPMTLAETVRWLIRQHNGGHKP